MSLKKYTGYHGTSKDVADKIIRTAFVINHGHQGFLGTGIYFFEENKDLAIEYATHRHGNKIIKALECILEVPEEEVFDTTLKEGAKKFNVYKEIVKETILKEKINLKVGNRNHFDGRVYDFVAKREKYTLIRAETFTPLLSDRKLDLRHSNVPNGVELCLKNPRMVIDKCICNE